jgi:hypothetical protein
MWTFRPARWRPADAIIRPETGLQRSGNCLQHLVANCMTVGVVDLLECVQVELNQRLVLARHEFFECTTQQAPESAPIHKPSQLVSIAKLDLCTELLPSR